MPLHTLCKIAGIFAVCLAAGTTTVAQYGGPPGGTMGGSGTGRYGSGSGKTVGIAVGAAAAAGVGIALLIHRRHQQTRSEASLLGCVQPVSNAMGLKNEKDGTTYMLLSRGTQLQLGERVEVRGVVTHDPSGAPALRVRHLVTDYGACSQTVASMDNPEKNDAPAVAK